MPEIRERGHVESPWGPALRIMVTDNDREMGWSEVWEAFAAAYPDQWAVEVYPPRSALVDEINARHLWVLPIWADPEPLRIDRR